MMGAETGTLRFPERVIRQVRLDSMRAMLRARYCNQRSEVLHLRCVDDRPESDRIFGSQLWFFEGIGVDEHDSRQLVYGVMEYSLQFGLHELVDDGVFDSENQRERFRSLYQEDTPATSWQNPLHRWLAAGMVAVAALTLMGLLIKQLAA